MFVAHCTGACSVNKAACSPTCQAKQLCKQLVGSFVVQCLSNANLISVFQVADEFRQSLGPFSYVALFEEGIFGFRPSDNAVLERKTRRPRAA